MIGIIAAMNAELIYLTELMENKEVKTISSVNFTKGTIHGKDVVCAVCGIGKVNAAITAEAMILTYKPDAVINTGVAGSLNDTLNIFDIAVSQNVVQHDMDTTPLGEPLGYISGLDCVEIKCDDNIASTLSEAAKISGLNYMRGVIATGDKFVEDKEEKKFLREHFNAIACEMEGGSIGHVCAVNNIPFGVIRSISDGNGSDHTDYITFMERAAKNSSYITELFIKNYRKEEA